MKMKKTFFLMVLVVAVFAALTSSCAGMGGLFAAVPSSGMKSADAPAGGSKTQTTGTAAANTAPAEQPAAQEVDKMPPLVDRHFEIVQNPDGASVTITKFSLSNRTGEVRTPSGRTDRKPIPYAELVIPERLYGLPVTRIAEGVFSRNKILNVVIHDSVTYIGDSAFGNCDITSVTLGSGLQSIGDYAFRDNKLTTVTIPDSVTAIGNSAFYNNEITSFRLPAGLTSIGNSVFSRNKLTSVNLAGITRVGDEAFANNELTSVDLAGITSIGDRAFADNQFTSVTLPAGLTSIGDRAFANYNTTAGPRIRSVTIPAGVERVGVNIFQMVTSYDTDSRGRVIGNSVTYGNSPITSITIAANVSDSDLRRSYGFADNFITFYGGQNRAAGTYTSNGPIWARSTAGGID